MLTSVVDDTGETPHFLTVIAASLVGTFNAKMGNPGVTLEDLWEELVLADFLSGLETREIHCPFKGAQESFSPAKTLKPSVVGLLQDSQLLFFPAGEFSCQQVMIEGLSYPPTIFLPEVCNLPLGMRWPVDIGLKYFNKASKEFLALQVWFSEWSL